MFGLWLLSLNSKLCCCLYQQITSFYCWEWFHGMNIPQFVHPFCWQTFGFFPALDYYEWICFAHCCCRHVFWTSTLLPRSGISGSQGGRWLISLPYDFLASSVVFFFFSSVFTLSPYNLTVQLRLYPPAKVTTFRKISYHSISSWPVQLSFQLKKNW